MSEFCSSRRLVGAPRPIRSLEEAVEVFILARSRPMRYETIVLVLDEARRGGTIVVVDGTHDPDAVVEVVETVAAAASDQLDVGGLVVASFRPGGTPDDEDVDRWVEMSHLADDFAVPLIEWIVVTDDQVALPRADTFDRARW